MPTPNPVFRSNAQGRILACVFADPEKSHSLTALMEWSDGSMPTDIDVLVIGNPDRDAVKATGDLLEFPDTASAGDL